MFVIQLLMEGTIEDGDDGVAAAAAATPTREAAPKHCAAGGFPKMPVTAFSHMLFAR